MCDEATYPRACLVEFFQRGALIFQPDRARLLRLNPSAAEALKSLVGGASYDM